MDLINELSDWEFEIGEVFMWRPKERTITYDPKRIETNNGKLQLLHEVGHALLSHQTKNDANAYQLERDAWDVARVLADKFGLKKAEIYISRQLKELRTLGY